MNKSGLRNYKLKQARASVFARWRNDFSSALRIFASERAVAAETALYAAWATLLYRYGAESESGVALAPFEEALALRVALSSETSAAAALEATRQSLETARRASPADFPLFLSARGDKDEMEIRLDYAEEQFDAESASRALAHLRALLQGMMDEPNAPIARLPLLTEAERRLIFEEWNDTRAAYPQDLLIYELFEAQVERSPETVALVFENQSLTYGELNRRANQLARRLRELGVGPNALVGVCMERSLEMVVALCAVLKAGGAYVPLDPSNPPQRLSFMLADSQAAILLAQEKFLPLLSRVERETPLFCLDRDWAQISDYSGENLPKTASPRDLAYMIYTSGSTGQPKGALNSHAGIFNRLYWMQQTYPLFPSDAVMQKTPFSFDVSVSEFFPPLMFGARLVVARPEGHKDPQYLIELIRREKITALHFVPSMLYAFLEAPEVSSCESVRRVTCSGEALPPELMNRFFARFPRVELLNLYGPTEAAVEVSHWRCQPDPRLKSVPIGKPVANTQLYILDRNLQPLPVGVTGELHIGGVQTGLGYWKRPELTAERFIPNPFGEGRLYKTGDLARYLPDGNIEFLGRADFQVKIRGLRVELGEIEAALEAHPAVRQAALVAQTLSAGQKRLAAYLTLKAEAARPSPAELNLFLQSRLPDHMIPGVYVFLDSFPLNPSGKIDRAALPEPELPPAEDFAPPQNETEAALAELWAELLGLPQIGCEDNLFELGCDSILIIQFVSRAQAKGFYFLPRHVFEAPIVRELARLAASKKPVQAEQGIVTGEAPLTPIQRWLFENHRVNPHYYNQLALLETARALRPDLLEQTLEHLLRHHDALRSRFEPQPAGWIQRFIEPHSAAGLVYTEDLSALPPQTQTERLQAVSRELQSGFDLRFGPLLRLAAFDFGTSRKVLFIVHHIVVDFISWQVLVSDFWTVYDALAQGRIPRLPEKSASFKTWARWLSESARRAETLAELEYWLEIGKQPVKPLPVDFPEGRAKNKVADAAWVEVSLSVEETRALLQDAPGAYRTQINDMLLSALAQAFCEWTGESSLLINLEGHGRESDELELSRTVGWFTSLFPVRLHVPRGDEGALLKLVKEQLLRIPRKGVNYGALRYLNPETSLRLAALPKPEVCFNYTGQLKTVSVQVLNAAWTSPEEELDYLFDAQAALAEDRLVVSWTYNQNLYARETVETLAGNFIRALRRLIAHCLAPQTGGYTPGDFPLCRLSQAELDRLIGRGENVEDVYPLSPVQAGMLFHSLYEPGSGMYFIQTAFRMEGALDLPRFQRAWQTATDRHPILRTSFAWRDLNEPVQIVHRKVSLPWEEYDWRALSPEEQSSRFEELLQTERRRGVDLERAPLARCLLIRLGAEAYQFVWQCHHLATDGWSVDILFKEVFEIYRDPATPLSPAEPYRDYIRWLSRRNMEEALEFWKRRLTGFSAPTPLGVDGAHPDEGYKTYRVELPFDLTARLNQFSRRKHVTLSVLTQGALALLLSKYSGEGEVVFGATVNGRPAELSRVEERLGPFINTLPLRVAISGQESVQAWLEDLQRQNFEQVEYEYAPLVEIQRQSGARAGTPLFESVLVFENYALNERTLPPLEGLRLGEFRSIEQTNYPLLISILPGERLGLSFAYDSRRFDSATIARMAEHYRRVLEGIVEDPAAPPARISALPEAERQALMKWNDTRVEFPPLCVQDWFEAQAQRSPEAPAVRFEGESLTYSELNRAANRLAHFLQKRGVAPDSLVGVYLERSPLMVVALLAILKAGGAYLPIDPLYPLERRKFIVEDSGLSLVLTQASLRGDFAGIAGCAALAVDETDFADEDDSNPRRATGLDNLAYVIYTSGSTGKPKGTLIPHRGLTNYLDWCLRAYPSGGVAPVHSSLSFDLTVTSLFPPLISGGCVLLLPESLGVDALEWALKHAGEFSLLKITPAHLRMLNERLHPSEAAGKARALVIGGESLRAEHINFWLEHAPDTALINEYGPTETVVGCCVYVLPPGKKEGTIPIGKPIQNARLYVLDEYMQLVPIGAAGELYIGGAGVARGYWNRPELTAARFLPDPFSTEPGARLYKTGDRARWLPDGNLEFLGRVDFQTKIRGYRVELEEIEAALSQQPNVKQAAVEAHPHSSGEKRLVAYLVLERRDPNFAAALRAALQRSLPDYMIPAVFVALDELPLTPNGKIDRKALPAPEKIGWSGAADFVPLQTPAEEILAGIWRDLLSCERVGRYDNFFELGGHSLIAAQLTSRLRQALGVELSLRAVFDFPTLADLAQATDFARRRESCAFPSMPQADRTQEHPLSFSQQRLWAYSQIEGANSAYNLSLPLKLKGRLNVPALEAALNEVVQRHESLRTFFPVVGDSPRQRVAPELRIALRAQDARGLDSQEIARLLQRDAERLFDLETGPLFRASLYQLADDEHILLLSMYHAVSDGWSLGILWRELSYYYQAEAPALPPLERQYIDFSVWQRKWLEEGVLETQLAYWKKQLAGAPTLLELPADHPRPPAQSFKGGLLPVEIPPALLADLKTLCRREGVSLFMLLSAAFATLLYRYSGQEDLILGSIIANRRYPFTEKMIGYFVNNLALRADLSGKPSFVEVLRRMRRVTLEAYDHQDAPFDRVVSELGIPRNLSHAPLFQVFFSLDNTGLAINQLADLQAEQLELETRSAKFDLSLEMTESAERLHGTLEYSVDLFERSTAERMVGHLLTLLAGAAADPAQPIASLPLLTEAERRQILEEWNETSRDFPRKTYQALFEEQVERAPERIAVAYETERLTYRELNERANQLAHRLRELGVASETIVGVCMERCVETLVSLLAILKSGGVYVPLDPALPTERLNFMIENSQAAVVLTKRAYAGRLSSCSARLIEMDDSARTWADFPKTNPQNLSAFQSPAYVIYTSGSTGVPKGAIVEQQGMVNHLYAKIYALNLNAEDRVAETAPQSFDISIWQFLSALLVGGATYIFNDDVARDPAQLLDAVEREKITILEIVPSLMRFVLEEAAARGSSKPGLSALRWLLLTGEALPPQHCRDWFVHYPNIPLMNAYGPTECSDDVTHYVIEKAPPPEMTVTPIGKAITNMRLYILDANRQPVPVGIPGELYVGGIGVGRGYLQNPERTAASFSPDPFRPAPAARFYKTGDLVRWLPDGNIEFLGRIDHQVKVRGFRIELGEIESVLARRPAVREAIVTARAEANGLQRLVAYLTTDEETLAAKERFLPELRNYLKEKLPEYMIPHAFVLLAQFPLTPNGKVDRKALPEPDSAALFAAEFLPPQTPEEKILAEIWEELLGVEQVGRRDNFFELGGDSIVSLQLINRAQARGLYFSPRQVFEAQTIEALARAASRAKTIQAEQRLLTGEVSLTPRSFDGRAGNLTPEDFPLARLTQSQLDSLLARGNAVEDLYPLSPLQAQMLAECLAAPEAEIYFNQSVFEIEGDLDAERFRAAWRRILERHDALRARFAWEGLAEPLQIIERAVELPWREEDWRGVSAEAQEERLRRALQEERRAGFDFSRAPLMRCALIRLDEARFLFVWNCHHLLTDGWSYSILLDDFMRLYEDPARNAPVPRPYRDYIAWLRGCDTNESEKFWREKLAGFSKPNALPRQKRKKPKGARKYGEETLILEEELSAQLRTLAQRNRVTLNAAIQAAWALLLWKYNESGDILFGVTVSGRSAPLADIESRAGLFINALPLRLRLSPETRLTDLLQEILRKQSELEQYVYAPAAPIEQPLFGSNIRFQNYPLREEYADGGGKLKITYRFGVDWWHYPLNLAVYPELRVKLHLAYDARYFDAASARGILRQMKNLLSRLPSQGA